MEVSLNTIHQRRAATPPIPYTTSHVFRKFDFAIVLIVLSVNYLHVQFLR